MVSVLPVKIKEQAEADAYRIYVTKMLRVISENTAMTTAAMTGGEYGGYYDYEFSDLISPPVEDKNPDEVISNVKDKLKKLSETG